MIGFWVSIVYEACSLATGQCDTVRIDRAPVYASVKRWDAEWCNHAGQFFAENNLRSMPLPAWKDPDNPTAKGHAWRVVNGTVTCKLVATQHETVGE